MTCLLWLRRKKGWNLSSSLAKDWPRGRKRSPPHCGVWPGSRAAGGARGPYRAGGRTGPTAAPRPSAAAAPAGCSAAQTRPSWSRAGGDCADRGRFEPGGSAARGRSVRPDPGPAPDTPGGGKRGTGGGRGAGVGRTSSGGGARGLRLGAANRARPGPSAAGAPGAHWLARRGAGESAPLWALGVARGVSWPPVGARQRGLRQPCGGPRISTGIYCSADRSPSASALKPTPSSELSEAGEVLVQRIAHQVEEGAGRSFSGRRVLLCLLVCIPSATPISPEERGGAGRREQGFGLLTWVLRFLH